MPMPPGRWDIHRIRLAPSADAADRCQALLVGAEPAVGRAAEVTTVKSAPSTILRVSRRADRSGNEQDASWRCRVRPLCAGGPDAKAHAMDDCMDHRGARAHRVCHCGWRTDSNTRRRGTACANAKRHAYRESARPWPGRKLPAHTNQHVPSMIYPRAPRNGSIWKFVDRLPRNSSTVYGFASDAEPGRSALSFRQ